MVELVGAYPVHHDLGVGGHEEVERRAVGTVTLVCVGQSPDGDPQWAAVGLGDEAARGVGLESEHGLDLIRRRSCLQVHRLLLADLSLLYDTPGAYPCTFRT